MFVDSNTIDRSVNLNQTERKGEKIDIRKLAKRFSIYTTRNVLAQCYLMNVNFIVINFISGNKVNQSVCTEYLAVCKRMRVHDTPQDKRKIKGINQSVLLRKLPSEDGVGVDFAWTHKFLKSFLTFLSKLMRNLFTNNIYK